MKRIVTLLMLLGLLGISDLIAQNLSISGYVFELNDKGDSIPLQGATIIWLNSQIGTTTDAKGFFMLQPAKSKKLTISYVGYKTDTVEVTDRSLPLRHVLRSTTSIEAVTVKANRGNTFIQQLNPIQTQVITSGELTRAACCNLSESFETNASIDVSYSDAITGAKQIQLLGLAGIYTQMQYENIPTMRGLASTFGLSYVPGPWMESIQVSKGTASVSNGYESITGQINIEYKKPWAEEKSYYNLYVNSLGMAEINANYTIDVNPKISTMLLVHGSMLDNRIDHNRDSFLDHPLSRQYHLFNRWKYQGKKWESQAGIKFMNEERLAGQVSFYSSTEPLVGNPYGVKYSTRLLEAFNKIGYIADRPNTSIGLINAITVHGQDATIGLRLHNAKQFSYYGNLIAITYIGNTNHSIKGGATFRYDRYDESLSNTSFDRTEAINGVYGEYTYKHLEMLTLMAGIRVDANSRFGTLVTPRFHGMVKPISTLTIRVSAGKGYRSPNFISENSNLLVSSRNIVVEENPKIEEAWNAGISINQNFKIDGSPYSITADLYRVWFKNQFIADIDRDRNTVYFYNLKGISYSNTMQVELTGEPVKNLLLSLAYRINDVKQTINDTLQRKPLVSSNKGLFTVGYRTPSRKWQFDYTLQYSGSGRLPKNSSPNENEFKPYVTMNMQVTKMFRRFDLYIGVENLTGFTQKNPIISWENPWSSTFDASQIWGPLTGQKFYAGLRMLMWK
ncbi:MAG: TonB-dependent receptor [Bacteroidota bacterium]